MKKLKLQLDDLTIESFETVGGLERFSGTVEALNTDEYSACFAEGCVTYSGCGTTYPASLQLDPWGCTVGDTCDNCGPTNRVDCSWDGQCTWGGNDTCGCESIDGCQSVGVC